MWSGAGLRESGEEPEDRHRHRDDENGPDRDLAGNVVSRVERRIGDHAHLTHRRPVWLRAATAIHPEAGGTTGCSWSGTNRTVVLGSPPAPRRSSRGSFRHPPV